MYRIRFWWVTVASSLWFLPAVMCVASVLTATATILIDLSLPEWAARLPLVNTGDAQSGRALLSAMLTGMITATSLAVSITMVVLALAAGQIGPRLIHTFIQDRTTQALLGTYMSNILFLLVVFRSGDGLDPTRAPNLSITIGTVWTAASLFLLLFHLHKLARSIIYDNIVDSVVRELMHTVDRKERNRPTPVDGVPALPGPGAAVHIGVDGYVQMIDHASLIAAAHAADAAISLDVDAGDFVLAVEPQALVHPPEACRADLVDAIRAAIVVGAERTPMQDIPFCIRQLTEIASRALSPGLNDLFTAMTVIDRLLVALTRVLALPPETAVAADEDGRARLYLRVQPTADHIPLAFDAIRRLAEPHPVVTVRLASTLERLAAHVRSEDQRDALRVQARMIADVPERVSLSTRDAEIVRTSARRALTALDAYSPSSVNTWTRTSRPVA